MQYVFFEKGIRRSWGIFENFCVKRSNLTLCNVTFNCKLQKKMGEQDALVAPQEPCWGAAAILHLDIKLKLKTYF